jgi:SOS-response transcriptional repressor LexA
MRKRTRNILSLCIFLLIANLPFITVTQLVGTETFLDSFENPDSYYLLQGSDNLVSLDIKEGSCIILQKTTNPNKDVDEGDIILYYKNNGELSCKKIYQINSIGPIKKYHTVDNNEFTDDPIYENQIVGKIVSIVDNNLWNMISMKIWDISIHEYNINALFTDS